MAQSHKAEGKIEIKSQADKFFNVWAHKTHLVPKMCPNKFHKVELHEGSHYHSLGSVSSWHYIANGRKEVFKTKVTDIDEKYKSINYICVDGSILNFYKNFKSKIEAIPKEEGCIVKWSFEYEKKHDDAPSADIYIDFLLAGAKDLDDRLCHA